MNLAACQRYDEKAAPSGWKIEPLKRRVWLEYGSALTEDDRLEGPFPVYGSNGQVGNHDNFLVKGPGILVGRKGSVGEVHFSNEAFWPIDTVYYVRRIGNDDWAYLYYLLTFLNLTRLNAATGVPGLTRRDAHYILGAFPEKSEQEAIAGLLKLGDEALQAARNELEKAERLKTSLFQQLFTSGMPGRHHQFKQTKIGQIPEEWDTPKLGSFADIEAGVALNPDRAPRSNAHQYLTVVNVQRGNVTIDEPRFLELWESEVPKKLLRAGDIMVVEGHANSGEIGRAAMIGADQAGFTYQNHLFRVRPTGEKITREFLLCALNTEYTRRHWNAVCNTSSGLNTINRRQLRRLLVPLPKPDEQETIVELIALSESAISLASNKVSALQRLKQSLLQSLLTGHFRLKEATFERRSRCSLEVMEAASELH